MLTQIPYDARRQLSEQRDGVPFEIYAAEIWNRRDAKQGPVVPSSKAWPFIRLDELPMSNVSRIKARAKG